MNDSRGFSLIELLVVAAVLGVVMAGAVGVLRTHSVTYTQQELSVALADNLRLGMTAIRDELRRAGYGVPSSGLLSNWIPWSGLGSSAVAVTQGSGVNPDQLEIAACTSNNVAELTADAPVGTSITVDNPGEFDAANKRLIRIGDSEFAWVKTVTGNSLTIDTNPSALAVGNQPLSRKYLTGTPICRVDVVTFDLQGGELRRDLNQEGPQAVATGITDLQITGPVGSQLEITLTGRTERPSPGTGGFATRGLATSLTMRN